MIVKAKRGYYVYSKSSVFGRRKRLAGPFASKKIAQGIHNKVMKRRTTKRKKGRK